MDKESLYEFLEESYFSEYRHEDDELKLLPELLKDVAIFIDVGASLGPYTKEANGILENSTIIAIEADPVRYERLKDLAAVWSKENNNKIDCIHCAVGAKKETVQFFTAGTSASGSLAPIVGRVDNKNFVEVEMLRLDDIVKETNKNIFVKMDIEGGEFMALEGAEGLIKDNNVTFLVELHDWGDSYNKKYPYHVLSLMREYGFYFKPTLEHYLFSKNIPKSERRSYYVRQLKFWITKNIRNTWILRVMKEIWFRCKLENI